MVQVTTFRREKKRKKVEEKESFWKISKKRIASIYSTKKQRKIGIRQKLMNKSDFPKSYYYGKDFFWKSVLLIPKELIRLLD
jgi:hypothetical protein